MKGRDVFVDSSAWMFFALQGHTGLEREQHRHVDEAFRELVSGGARFVTTNLVVVEAHQLILIKDRRDTGLAFLRSFPIPGVEVVVSTADLELRALRDWVEPYSDHDFSLADGVSFVVMKDRGVRRALTLDRHFATAGFELVPLG